MLLDINWSPAEPKTISPYLFGVNNYRLMSAADNTEIPAFDPATVQLYQDAGIQFVRFHLGPLMDEWTDPLTFDWKYPLIEKVYAPWKNTGVTILQTISKPPTWMAFDLPGILKVSEHQRYADLCAKLVKFLNIDMGMYVEYWETSNERNKLYLDAKRLPDLYDLHNKCYDAMKLVDRSIKVGGLALTYDDGMVAKSFLQASKPTLVGTTGTYTTVQNRLDFQSFHRYSSTSQAEEIEGIMARTDNYKAYVEKMRKVATDLGVQGLPIMLNEYNINYDYRDNERRNTTYIGVPWFASAVKHMAEAGLEFGAMWNFQDNTYGLINADNQPYPAYHLFKYLNQAFARGTMATVTSNDPNVEGLAVTRPDGKRALMFWHKGTSIDTFVQIKSSIPATADLYGFRMDIDGVNHQKIFATSFNGGTAKIAMVPYRLIVIPSF